MLYSFIIVFLLKKLMLKMNSILKKLMLKMNSILKMNSMAKTTLKLKMKMSMKYLSLLLIAS